MRLADAFAGRRGVAGTRACGSVLLRWDAGRSQDVDAVSGGEGGEVRGVGGWPVAAAHRVRDRSGSAQVRIKASNPPGSVTSKKLAPPAELTVKLCGVPWGRAASPPCSRN